MTEPAKDATYEEKHVHQVYQDIAPHFSSTRHKPWPVVDDYLRSLPPGSVGLDIGCGNGKYLPVNRDVFIIASDRSPALVSIASQHQPHTTLVADILDLPHPDHNFDFAISIAVVHHLSTPSRRVDAIRAILQTLKTDADGDGGGTALIFVWALEQKGSRRGWDVGDKQDVLVPWVMKGGKRDVRARGAEGGGGDGNPGDVTFHRYYHLYREGELQRDVEAAGARLSGKGMIETIGGLWPVAQ